MFCVENIDFDEPVDSGCIPLCLVNFGTILNNLSFFLLCNMATQWWMDPVSIGPTEPVFFEKQYSICK